MTQTRNYRGQRREAAHYRCTMAETGKAKRNATEPCA